MIAYWLLFSMPALAALFETPDRGRRKPYRTIALSLALLLAALMIGLRYQVGGDWNSYLGYFWRAEYVGLTSLSSQGDPGYVGVNWLVNRLGGDVWQVNLICAALFCMGLFAFCRSQPRPWLALAVAVPYLVIVIAMGYTRQSVAIGLAMLGLVALSQARSNVRFVFWIVLAATFHKSAVLLIPIAALTAKQGRWWTVLWIAAATVGAYFTLLETSVDELVGGYLEAQYQSDGAAIRVAMNAVPAVLFVLFRRRFDMSAQGKKLWLIISCLALAMIPALIFSPSSTAVDRIALYMIPLQLVVLSRLPDVFGRSPQDRQLISLGVVLYAAMVQFVWLNFASHAFAWVPYQVFPS